MSKEYYTQLFSLPNDCVRSLCGVRVVVRELVFGRVSINPFIMAATCLRLGWLRKEK